MDNKPVIEKDNKHIKSKLRFSKSFSDKLANMITLGFGNMKFLCFCLLFFIIWISWNTGQIPHLAPFDPYPFPMLTMMVSLFAIILSVAVLISQNREGKLDKIRQQIEFEVNVQAETEITKMLAMLHDIQKKLGIENQADIELEKMKESIDIHELHDKIKDIDPLQ